MNKNLTNLENHIYNSIPRLRELSCGCEIEQDGNRYMIDNHFVELFSNNQIHVQDNINSGWFFFDEYEIIDHPILLNDVLEWLKDLSRYTTYAIESDGCFLVNKGGEWTALTYLNSKNNNQVVFWDVTKPALKDQSQELIDALCELIPKDDEKQK